VIRSNVGSVAGVHGLRLAYRTWEAANARAALVVVHGIGDHAGRYAEFGRRMAGYGISTFAMDLRGHGLSDGRRGHVPAFDIYLQELDRFRREVEGLADFRVPLFLLGHSMGGLIALRYQEEYNTRFEGAIIISPWLATAMPIPRLKAAAANLLSRLLPSLPFNSGIRADQLSRDHAVVEAYRSDPLVHGSITPRLFTEASTAMGFALQRSDRIQEPLLFLLAGDDRIVDTDRSVRFARSITATDTNVRVYPGAFHELLHEVDRAHIHREVRDWIAART
jgi:alpha-beta hydrolase superfamily lysophospholipase